MNPPIRRRRGAPTGFFLILLGAWGALVPFIGPYFNYQIGTTNTWDWSIDRLWLNVLPGAAAVIGGLILLASGRRLRASTGALIALLGGLWFVVGPSVSMLWNDGAPATGAAIGDNGTRVLEWIGFYYGTGALITLLSAYALGFMAALPVVDEVTVPATAAPGTAATAAAPAAGGTATAPAGTAAADDRAPVRRRRRFLRRPGARTDDRVREPG